ncbi:hypothetical protein N657DRAFT_235283 [Parathielavia appendiculata]|uniref:Uncharacterized protein n=1 Tax=Parathielavia appendiculata TaxID=2587402 RepID=A0AAN6U8N4_9PEZI|nr:hypothetical protein N657DRAFT_235283 [Parathielavia appendiculata]
MGPPTREQDPRHLRTSLLVRTRCQGQPQTVGTLVAARTSNLSRSNPSSSLRCAISCLGRPSLPLLPLALLPATPPSCQLVLFSGFLAAASLLLLLFSFVFATASDASYIE